MSVISDIRTGFEYACFVLCIFIFFSFSFRAVVITDEIVTNERVFSHVTGECAC